MDSKVKGLTIGIIVLAIALASVIFLLRGELSQELVSVATPWGGCLKKFDILRNTGIASFSGGERMTEYQFEVFGEFRKDNCQYHVFRWMPEHYPERSYVDQGWYHEFRIDLSEEQKQKLRDAGAWPD